jgi:hypothetical protein
MSQFSNPLDRELAVAELDQLRCNPATEHLNSLRTWITSLFNRARFQEWAIRRPYVLKMFDDDMRRAVRFPPTEEQLWAEAQAYYPTEQTLSPSRHKLKQSSGPARRVVPVVAIQPTASAIPLILFVIRVEMKNIRRLCVRRKILSPRLHHL